MRRFPILVFASLLGLLFGVCAIGHAADRPARKYALVVGVHEYRRGQPLPDLKYAEPDAEQLAKVLAGGGYQVTLMTQTAGGKKGNFDKLPTASNIRDHLGGILGNPFLKEQDTVLLALAGHGVLLRVKEEDKTGKEQIVERFFFCPMDAEIASLIKAAKETPPEFFSLDDVRKQHHLLSMDELYTQLGGGCKAGLKVLFTDACRNDPSRDLGARAVESLTLPPLPPPPGGVAALFSCSAHQKAQEDPALGHGVFFHYVIEGLGGKADFSKDGNVTLSELNEYVGSNTYDFVYKKYKAKQIPELKGTIRRAELLKLGLSKLITNSLGMKLVQIPAGEFQMGSPENEKDRDDDQKQHRVRITQAFYLGQHEVTQDQWQNVMNTTPWKGKSLVKEGSDYPATYVSWDDAIAFCKKLTEQERKAGRLPEDWEYTLPTEAQWEYACRAGTKTAFHFGNDDKQLGEYAWFEGNAQDIDEKYTHEVGQKKANPWGLHDMHGNVWEWCSDWFDSDYYGKSPVDDPTGPEEGSGRVYRGGGWGYAARVCRSAFRSRGFPSFRSFDLGFRVARVLSSK